MHRSNRLTPTVVAVAAALIPLYASAATQQAASQTTAFTPGALSITAPAPTTFPATAVSVGTLTAGVNAANWADSTGGGAGWNGTISAAGYTVTVTLASLGASPTVAISWSGEETGSGVATKGTPFAVGALGMTIDFLAGQAYALTDVYTAQVGNLPTTALAVAQGTTTISALGTTKTATNLPTPPRPPPTPPRR